MGYFANRRRRKAAEAARYAAQRTNYSHTPYPVDPITQATLYTAVVSPDVDRDLSEQADDTAKVDSYESDSDRYHPAYVEDTKTDATYHDSSTNDSYNSFDSGSSYSSSYDSGSSSYDSGSSSSSFD